MSKLTLEKASLRYGIPLLTLHGAIDRGLLQTDADRSLESTDIEALIDHLLNHFVNPSVHARCPPTGARWTLTSAGRRKDEKKYQGEEEL